MSPRNEVFQAVPFDATSDAKEPLIATGDAGEEGQGLEKRDLSSFKLSSLLLGLLVGFFFQFSTIYCVMKSKSKTDVILFSLLWSLFASATPVLMLVFIRNLGCSEELLEDMILQLECHFGVGVLAGICLACTIMDVLLGTRTHVVAYPLVTMVVAFIWCKVTMMASATDSKPSSTRRSTAEQTMMAV
jgi:hypothetical protein